MQICCHGNMLAFPKPAEASGNDACSDAVRHLARCPKSAEVGSCFRTLKSMAESVLNSFGKAGQEPASFTPEWQASQTSIFCFQLHQQRRILSEQFPWKGGLKMVGPFEGESALQRVAEAGGIEETGPNIYI